MSRVPRGAQSPSLALMLAAVIGVGSVGATAAAQPSAPAAAQAAHPGPPAATLGPHGPSLEGTWELVLMKLPDGTVLKPPIARGVIVIEKGVYLAASYLQPTSARTVGSVWEGQMIIEGEKFRLLPKTGYSYDSMAEQRVHSMLPPIATGTVSRSSEGLVFTKDGGGKVTFTAGTNTRRQVDPDGLIIEHVRTSLTPRIPDDLPGRETGKHP